MPAHFDLLVTADYPNRTAEFRLLDANGVQLGYRHTDFKSIPVGRQQGLFDLRNYLKLYVEKDKETTTVAEIGVCIAEEVLGEEIFLNLWQSESQRTLRIQLPGATAAENHLATALARVPWEIARPAAGQATLSERNLVIRVVQDMQAPASQPLELAPDESLRVLFVFAEARGSRPLGARKERLALQQLFDKEIYPRRRVVAHFLSHGVTRERLQEQILDNGGYHVLHWSGHGHLNLLELAKSGGAKDHLSGEELLDLFTDAGGFIPRFAFLSACHSGDILRVEDWNDFLAIAQGKEPGTRAAENRDIDIKQQPGFTGTAHALLNGGVPTVVAMRYSVGDDYARELAVGFYRALLAHTAPKNADVALTTARRVLQNKNRHDRARFAVCDHATPVLYGREQPGLTLVNARSPAFNPRNPRLHYIAELTTSTHEHFVGRTWELADLGAEFIGSSMVTENAVAVITGLGGMGKTSLVAEALALWETRFEWVLLYQAKPNPLGFESTLRDIHLRLMDELGRYHDHIRLQPAAAIYRDVTADFTGHKRLERLTRNLIRALKDESILLVLDNFETNLKSQAEPTAITGHPVWRCQDQAWDDCLARLATELTGSPSRVLITCRKPIAALAEGQVHQVLLGPLPPAEAALYLGQHPALSQMVFGGDSAEQALALRLLNASRFHPLLMDQLARLAATPDLRPQLLQAIETLENTSEFSELPAIFAPHSHNSKELAYLNDALATSLDQLIADASPDARRLLWVIAMANDPVEQGMLQDAWNVWTEAGQVIQPLLRGLMAVGLAAEEPNESNDANPNITCHELVRERILTWMKEHPYDRAELTENTIRLAHAACLEGAFNDLQHEDMTSAIEAGRRAIVYCVQVGDYDSMVGLASAIVGSTQDPHLLQKLISYLQSATESAPEVRTRCRCLGVLAAALIQSGNPEESLPIFEQAASIARAVTEGGGQEAQQAWNDFATISANWAMALRETGEFDAARQHRLDAAEALKKAGSPTLDVIVNELEGLRVDIMQGRVETALPELEKRLKLVKSWWQMHRSGQAVPEAPDPVSLANIFIGTLDLARQAHFVQEDWQLALDRADVALEVALAIQSPKGDIAQIRANRANVLSQLDRFGEAKTELETCLQLFEDNASAKAITLSMLAKLYSKLGYNSQAATQERRALAIYEQHPDPEDRATSHKNLADYLANDADTLPEIAKVRCHKLAALLYRLAAGTGREQTMLRSYVLEYIVNQAIGLKLDIPRIDKLLADPTFHPLKEWLAQHDVHSRGLQNAVNQFMEQVRQLVRKTK